MKRTEAVKGGRASYSGYCVFEDGTEPTLDAAPLYLDASVPPILGAYVTGWVPTIFITRCIEARFRKVIRVNKQ